MRPYQVLLTALLTVPLATATTVGVARLVRRAPPPAQSPTLVRVTEVIDRGPTDCERRRDELQSLEALPGVPEIEAARAEILARAKAEPIVFVTKPQQVGASASSLALRERLHEGGVPWQALSDIFSQLKRHPKRLREVLLTDGYLYAEKPALAALLSSGISLNQLFTEKELELTRGDVTRRVVRVREDYVWADGPEASQPARLWLYDRVAVEGERLSPAKHVAIGGLRDQLGATRIQLVRLTKNGALADIVYGDQQVPTVLALREGRLNFECEIMVPRSRREIEAARRLARRHARVIQRLRTAILEQVEEALPFDEPKTEEGQQDGKLRQEWRTAYLQGRSVFSFNGDEYPVFGSRGIPRIPQVCVDFITDSWERMADTRWQKREQSRTRRVGRLDFDALGIENRRSVENLIDFAVAHPEWFEPLLIPESERIAFSDRSGFFRRLLDLRTDFQPGDVVAILGPRDDDKLHYHSFFIVETDPLTAMPTLLAANAGKPRIRTWEGEMQNAPRRSIMARIRPRLEWLEAIVGADSDTRLGG